MRPGVSSSSSDSSAFKTTLSASTSTFSSSLMTTLSSSFSPPSPFFSFFFLDFTVSMAPSDDSFVFSLISLFFGLTKLFNFLLTSLVSSASELSSSSSSCSSLTADSSNSEIFLVSFFIYTKKYINIDCSSKTIFN